MSSSSDLLAADRLWAEKAQLDLAALLAPRRGASSYYIRGLALLETALLQGEGSSGALSGAAASFWAILKRRESLTDEQRTRTLSASALGFATARLLGGYTDEQDLEFFAIGREADRAARKSDRGVAKVLRDPGAHLARVRLFSIYPSEFNQIYCLPLDEKEESVLLASRFAQWLRTLPTEDNRRLSASLSPHHFLVIAADAACVFPATDPADDASLVSVLARAATIGGQRQRGWQDGLVTFGPLADTFWKSWVDPEKEPDKNPGADPDTGGARLPSAQSPTELLAEDLRARLHLAGDDPDGIAAAYSEAFSVAHAALNGALLSHLKSQPGIDVGAALKDASKSIDAVGDELTTTFKAAVATRLEPVAKSLEVALHALEGKNFGSLEANKRFASELSEILRTVGLRCTCSTCGAPALLQVADTGGAETGTFRFSHNREDSKGTDKHGGSVGLPALKIVPAPRDRRRKAMP